ncbi:MAG TPA: hemerythrin domain-containing protein [Caulobacter sp.]|nr:hemerythrin domain-containing protein [Caulobacter sp.]
MAATAADQDAIALLKADHRKVEELFASFEKARGAERKQTLVQQICTELTVHTIIEEEIFYPACKGAVEEDLLDEAYVEHDGAKVLIAELLGSEPDEAFYDAKVKVLSEQIEHHVEEEEKRSEGMFAQARKAGLDMDALGDQMRARKEALTAKFESEGLPPPETRSFAGHDLVEGEPVDEEDSAPAPEAPEQRP